MNKLHNWLHHCLFLILLPLSSVLSLAAAGGVLVDAGLVMVAAAALSATLV